LLPSLMCLSNTGQRSWLRRSRRSRLCFAAAGHTHAAACCIGAPSASLFSAVGCYCSSTGSRVLRGGCGSVARCCGMWRSARIRTNCVRRRSNPRDTRARLRRSSQVSLAVQRAADPCVMQVRASWFVVLIVMLASRFLDSSQRALCRRDKRCAIRRVHASCHETGRWSR